MAIARAIAFEPKLVILDEPTANLSATRVATVLQLVSRLKQLGVAVIIISHRSDELFEVADRITVIRHGRCVASRRVEDVSPAEVARLIAQGTPGRCRPDRPGIGSGGEKVSAVSVRATPKQIASLTGPGRRFIATYGVLVLLAVFCIFLAITQASSFLTASNLSNILVQQSVVALIAMAETCVMITSGIDLSVGAVIGFTGLVAAKIAQHGHNGLAVPLLVALAIGAAIGFIQSLIIVYGKIQPFLVTFAGLGIISGYSLIYSNRFSISGLNHSYDSLGQGSIAGIPSPLRGDMVLILPSCCTACSPGPRLGGICSPLAAVRRPRSRSAYVLAGSRSRHTR